jgi:hypothetical protein
MEKIHNSEGGQGLQGNSRMANTVRAWRAFAFPVGRHPFAEYQGRSLHHSGHLTLCGVRVAFTMVR